MRRLVVLLLVLLPLAFPTPAHAKGPTDVVVTGPGIDDESLSDVHRPGYVAVFRLAKVTGLFGPVDDRRGGRWPQADDPDLGPRYVLTWYVGSTPLRITHAYPFAVGGAWAYSPYASSGGWVWAGSELRQALVRLGAERPEEDAEPGGSTSSLAVESGSRATVEPTGTSTPILGLAGLTLLAGAGAWLVRRRLPGTLSAWRLHRST